MFDDVDEVLRQLLIREIPIRSNEIDIAFDQPKREWSARLSRPTLNLFLYKLHENTRLRQQGPQWDILRNGDGTATRRRYPARIDLHYLITAWATEPDDEHRLLGRSLVALLRQPYLPDDLLPESLRDQSFPIPIEVALPDTLPNEPDLWGVLDNEHRPGIVCVVTIALDPYRPITAPLVRTRELRVGQPTGSMKSLRLDNRESQDVFWTIGGRVHGEVPLDRVRLLLIERGLTVEVEPDGRFAIGNLRAGDYTLEISVEGREPQRRRITVPSADYDFEI